MPIYEYKCSSCEATEEHFQRMTDKRKKICKKCGEKTLERVISPSAVIFKGEGFYCNDYPKKN
jgi:putative FmdB family regulatory protein